MPAATAPPPLPRARPQRAAAQAGQRVCLIPGDADLAGQVKRPLVTRPGPVEIASEPVQRPRLVKRLGFGAAIADFPVDAQPFFQVTSRAGEVPGQAPHSPQIGKGVGEVETVTGAPGDVQRLFQVPRRGGEVSRAAPDQPKVVESLVWPG